ncbi:MAG TPA: DNA recombination protein RmuC [Acidobacteriaceae bacterium]|nr:DNA recombination protein RmuC [Acidobacteriaceae bacterium]
MLLYIVIAVASLVLGFVIAWLLSQTNLKLEKQRVTQLETDLAQRTAERDSAQREFATAGEARLNLEKAKTQLETQLTAEKNALEEAKKSLSDAFSALASKALKDNNQSFLELARQELGKQQITSAKELEAKETAIASLLKPVGEALTKLQSTTQELEVKREGAYSTVLTEIKNVQETHQSLRRETTQLIQALRAPKARGNWGQLQLQRCVEFAGMVEHASFDLEVHVRKEDEALRPDCIVYLPNGRTIVIDAKTPFDAFLDAMNTSDEAARDTLLAAHAARVREHLKDLSAKAYWKQFQDSPDFVVCFLPSEVLFSAALEKDPDLIEYGSNSNVILATPTTLIALLKAVAYGWQQMDITRNAIAIREAGQKLYDKLATAQSYFSKLGNSLKSTVDRYNDLIGCVEGRDSVFDQARKLHQLGIGQRDLQESEPFKSELPRELKGKDWVQDSNTLSLAADAEKEP